MTGIPNTTLWATKKWVCKKHFNVLECSSQSTDLKPTEFPLKVCYPAKDSKHHSLKENLHERMGQNEYPVKTYRKSLISVITNQDYITKF